MALVGSALEGLPGFCLFLLLFSSVKHSTKHYVKEPKLNVGYVFWLYMESFFFLFLLFVYLKKTNNNNNICHFVQVHSCFKRKAQTFSNLFRSNITVKRLKSLTFSYGSRLEHFHSQSVSALCSQSARCHLW